VSGSLADGFRCRSRGCGGACGDEGVEDAEPAVAVRLFDFREGGEAVGEPVGQSGLTLARSLRPAFTEPPCDARKNLNSSLGARHRRSNDRDLSACAGGLRPARKPRVPRNVRRFLLTLGLERY
jgi:hypothetical protein